LKALFKARQGKHNVLGSLFEIACHNLGLDIILLDVHDHHFPKLCQLGLILQDLADLLIRRENWLSSCLFKPISIANSAMNCLLRAFDSRTTWFAHKLLSQSINIILLLAVVAISFVHEVDLLLNIHLKCFLVLENSFALG